MEKRKLVGRPPKFEETRRPITVTLPERTLQQLAAIDPDRAHAIVKAVTLTTGFNSEGRPLVDVVDTFPGQAIILVGPSKRLQEIEWLRLLEIAPARYLLLVPTGTPTESLELAVGDILDHLTPNETYEHELLGELHKVLRHRRRQQEVSKGEILLIRSDRKP
jgi:hypothetical protein